MKVQVFVNSNPVEIANSISEFLKDDSRQLYQLAVGPIDKAGCHVVYLAYEVF